MRTNLSKQLFLSAVLMLVIVPFSANAQLSVDSIYALLNREVAAKRTPCIVVGLIDSTGKRQVVGAGRISEANPASPNAFTMFEIASVTKVFTSLLLAEMSLQQKINLDSPFKKYLPANVFVPAYHGKEVTLMHLATHTAGYPRMPDNANMGILDNPFADYSEAQLYNYISRFSYKREPGIQFQYSNVGYALLGNIESRLTGKDFEALVKERIGRPLGLKNTTIHLTAAQKAQLATGHSDYGRPVFNWDMPAIAGTGALRSNMADLLTFAAANLGIIKSSLYAAMQFSHIPRIPKGPGEGQVSMGWTVVSEKGHDFLWKDGTTAGYRSLILLDRTKKNGIVVLSACLNPINDIAYHILDTTYSIQPYRYKWGLLDTVLTTVKVSGAEAAINLYHQLKQNNKSTMAFDDTQLHYVATELRRNGRLKEAISIAKLNVKEYPSSSLVYESLGELYRLAEDNKAAISCFEKQLEVDPGNPHCYWLLSQLREKQ